MVNCSCYLSFIHSLSLMASHSELSLSLIFPFLLLLLLSKTIHGKSLSFSIREAAVSDLQLAFHRNQLTSRQLVEFYIREIHRLNPILKGVLELNPDALAQADRADRERRRAGRSLSNLHGIPILVKDNIATKDKMNTTAGSYALLGSVVSRDAGVVTKLRKAGAIILGKATLSEWSNYRGNGIPSGWSARGGQGKVIYFSFFPLLPCVFGSLRCVGFSCTLLTVIQSA